MEKKKDLERNIKVACFEKIAKEIISYK